MIAVNVLYIVGSIASGALIICGHNVEAIGVASLSASAMIAVAVYARMVRP